MRLHGSAEICFLKTDYQAQVAIDLSSGEIELWFARHQGPTALEQLRVLSRGYGAPALTNLRLATPFGELRRDTYSDYFVLQHDATWTDPADHRGSDAVFSEGTQTITRQLLQPRHSLLEFECVSLRAAPGYQVVYEASMARVDTAFPLTWSGGAADVKIAANRWEFSSAQPWLESTETIRSALGVLCGGPVSVRSERLGAKLGINVAPHTPSAAERLWIDGDDIPALLTGLVHVLHGSGNNDEQAARLRRAAHFHAHGLGNAILLDLRIITLYTELEMLDAEKTLAKKDIALLLDTTVDEAALLCEVRNALVHEGKSLSEAVLHRHAKCLQYKPSFAVPELYLDSANRSRIASTYYFRLAGLLNRFWVRQARFTGPFNDYVHCRG